MDFEFSEEQRLLREAIAKWAANTYDFDKRRAMLAEGEAWRAHWAQIADMGLLAAPIAEEHGGLGGDAVDVLVIMEEFGKALVTLPFASCVVLAGGAIAACAAPAQKEEHLGAIAAGARIFAFAHAEPKARYNLTDVAAAARKDGAGYVLNGAKAVVIGAPQADHLLVSARTSGAQRDRGGITLFAVPKDASGVVCRDYSTVDGFRASEIAFDNVKLGAEHRIGEEGEAFDVIETVTDQAIAAACAEGVGVMRMLQGLTLEYARTRKQFGRAIAEFQVLQHRLVDMFIEVEESVSMAYLAAIKARAPALERAKAVSSAKAKIGRALTFVGENAVQIHGGMGVTDEMRVAHYFKRATMIEAQFGNRDHHVARVRRLSRAAA